MDKKSEANPKSITYGLLALIFFIALSITMSSKFLNSQNQNSPAGFSELSKITDTNSGLKNLTYTLSRSQDQEEPAKEDSFDIQVLWGKAQQYIGETFENNLFFKAYKSASLIWKSTKIIMSAIGTIFGLVDFPSELNWLPMYLGTIFSIVVVFALVYFARSGK
jgi:hypothetical protein